MATTVNRYTQYQPARYTPRTLQELMIVPAYKRQQHDTLQQNISTLQQQLNKYDNLDIHDPLVQAEKQRLQDTMNSQLESLSSEGFNQSNKSNFINFNSDYQQAVGTEGVIGKASAVKKKYIEGLEKAIKNAPKEYSPEQVKRYYDQDFQNYVGNYDGKTIENIPISGIAGYHNFEDDYFDLASKVGENEWENLIGKGAYITDVGGIPQMVIDDRTQINKSNEIGLNAANNLLANKYAPGTEARRSMEIQGLGVDDMNNVLTQGKQMMLDTSARTKGGKSFKNLPANYYKNQEDSATGSGLLFLGSNTVPREYHDMPYQEMEEKQSDLKTIVESGEASREQLAEYDKINDFMGRFKAQLTDNPAYNSTLKELQEAQQAVSSIYNGYDYKNDPIYSKYGEEYLNNNPEVEAKVKQEINQKLINNANRLESKLDEITEDERAMHMIKVSDIALAPRTTQEQSMFKRLNNNIQTTFSNIQEPIKTFGTITSLEGVEGGSLDITDPKDRKGINDLISKAATSKNGITFAKFTMEGKTGKPELVFSVPTKEGQSYDLEGLNTWGSKKYEGNIGNGETIKVRVAINENFEVLGEKLGIDNLAGLIQGYIANSSPTGAKLVKRQEVNRFYNNNQGRTWGDIKDNLSNPLINELWVKSLTEEMGINEKSSDQDIKAAMNELLKRRIVK